MRLNFVIILGFIFCSLFAQDAPEMVKRDTLKIVSDSLSGGQFVTNLDKDILALANGRVKNTCTVAKKVIRKKSTPPSVVDVCKKQSKTFGYKIQIFYTKDRATAQRVRAEFSRKYPGIYPELVYWQPDYRILVGDYFSKRSGASDLAKIKKQYPSSFFVKHRIYCRRAK